MNRFFYGSGCALALMIASVFTSTAPASLISFSGNSSDGPAVTGTAEITPGAGTAAVKLTNTTTTTLDAGELFTGIDFSLGGLTPSLATITGIERNVVGSGAFTDTGSAQNLSWSLVSLGGGSFQLNFNPNAKDAIIGPPSGGNYSGSNGSIKGNNGHNPFTAETATIVLTVPGATANTPVSVTTFRYGTGLHPADGTISIPEPSTCALLLFGLVAAAWRRTC
jgi:PEP-CTERM motif